MTDRFPAHILGQKEWEARRDAHHARARVWTDTRQARTRLGERHAIYDFLFTYYSFRPSWLKRWHPGPGVMLQGEGAAEFLRWREYRETADGVTLDTSQLRPTRREFVVWLKTMLSSMETRPAFFGCFGLHEWAMVYKQTQEEVRHNAHPLRLSPSEIAQIVEARGVACTHYDAFRFFTSAARPLNTSEPTRETTTNLEQRGCLHANMDLYKWAYKLAPFTSSEFVADCFELAYKIREIDMRASPYDLRALGFSPLEIETPEGRAKYEEYQREFAELGEPLRAHLVDVCDWIERGSTPEAC